MSDTATKKEKKEKKAKAKPVEAIPTAAPVEAPVEVKAEAPQADTPAPEVKVEVLPAVDEAKTDSAKRKKKNTTVAVIDPSNPESVTQFLSEFLAQSAAQPPTKGYDQHVNREGFVHAGTAQRLSNGGISNMLAVQFDILARRSLDGDKAAGEFYDTMLNFALNRREQVKAERKAKILAEANAILAEEAAKANA